MGIRTLAGWSRAARPRAALARALPCLLFLLGCQAHAADCVITFGYPDREIAPYYLGNGAEIPARPGAGAELVMAAFAAQGCRARFVRLPIARLGLALLQGDIDMAPFVPIDGSMTSVALPLRADGSRDFSRALRTLTVVFVRAEDKAAADADPAAYFRHHLLATNQGSPLAAQLRLDGYKVDDGAKDTMVNIEKLIRKRVDGYTFSIFNEEAFDKTVAEHFGRNVLRLKVPLRQSNVFLSANRDYYSANPARVERIWRWLGAEGGAKLDELVRKY